MISCRDVVGPHVTAAVPTASAGDAAENVLQRLRGRCYDCASAVYVLDDARRLIGVASLEDLLSAGPGAAMADVMRSDPPSVRPDARRADAASLALHEGIAATPVTDKDGRFIGVLPPYALMGVLRDEHLRDLHHMAGIWKQSRQASEALHGSPVARARYRLPWLMLGLVGSVAAAKLVAGFESALEANLAIAFFIPSIVYLADAVGTQSETVAVRGLSLTETGLAPLLAAEVATGALLGAVLALLGGAAAYVLFGGAALALTVGVSLLFACSVATAIGLTLPWAFDKAGWDPALASGPIGTIVQDLLSLLIYFTAAALIIAPASP